MPSALKASKKARPVAPEIKDYLQSLASGTLDRDAQARFEADIDMSKSTPMWPQPKIKDWNALPEKDKHKWREIAYFRLLHDFERIKQITDSY